MDMFHPIWRLSEPGESNLGLACNEEGLVLGRTPLLERRGGRFAVRDSRDIQRLLSRAYRTRVDASSLMSGLATVAAALNANDLLLARIAAVHLRIPDLSDQTARDALAAEDRLIKAARNQAIWKSGDAEWNPTPHPRAGTAPNPGWFAPTDGSADGSSSTRVAQNEDTTDRADVAANPNPDWVRLPSSDDDIDELHDLVEWIANAKPEDEAAIRAEIKKHFYDVGDIGGGNALNRALSDSLEAGNDKKARQEILDSIAIFAKNDPAIIGFARESLPLLAIPGMGPGRAAEEGAAVEAEAGAAAADAAAQNPWKMGWAKRGNYLHEQLGANLPRTFKGIDDFVNGAATSIKSIDLNAATYQDYSRLSYTLDRYINKLANYEDYTLGDITVRARDITSKTLSMIIPRGSMTSVQRAAFDAARSRAEKLGIKITITEF
jgi:contact-dependent growth inhibition (CDI) system restriction endonuclease-like protein